MGTFEGLKRDDPVLEQSEQEWVQIIQGLVSHCMDFCTYSEWYGDTRKVVSRGVMYHGLVFLKDFSGCCVENMVSKSQLQKCEEVTAVMQTEMAEAQTRKHESTGSVRSRWIPDIF